MDHGLVFMLGERQLALPLSLVSRVVRAVEITRLPDAAATVPGVIDVHGEVVPVVDLRQRFGLPTQELDSSAQFVLVGTASRQVALWVDCVDGVAAWEPSEFVAGAVLSPGTRLVSGVVRRSDGLILVHDLDALMASAFEDVPASMEGDKASA